MHGFAAPYLFSIVINAHACVSGKAISYLAASPELGITNTKGKGKMVLSIP